LKIYQYAINFQEKTLKEQQSTPALSSSIFLLRKWSKAKSFWWDQNKPWRKSLLQASCSWWLTSW